MEALLLDVKNYDAFRELVEGSMMSASEGQYQFPLTKAKVRAETDWAEWDFVQSLAYRKQLSDEEARFVRLMYVTKLKKVRDSATVFIVKV